MKKILKILLGSVVVITLLLGYLFYSLFFDMKRLPEGELLTESVSPKGTYTIQAYIVQGNATVSNSIRGELIFNNKNKKSKNIYWENKKDEVVIDWTADDKVIINGHKLNLPNDKYDFRNK